MHRKLSLHIRLTAILLLCVCFGSQLPAQTQIPVNFDERTDLLSVVFRLAGNSEYNLCEMTFYADNVDQHFAPYKNHQVVTLAKQYYRTGIGYDAVASFAMHIVLPTNDKESITIDPQFEAGGDRSFDRWSEDKKTIHIALDLEPDTHYAFSILGEQFRTSDGYHAIGTHFIDFWTNK